MFVWLRDCYCVAFHVSERERVAWTSKGRQLSARYLMDKIITKKFLVGEVNSFAVQTKPLSLWSEKKKEVFQNLAKKKLRFVKILEVKRERSPGFPNILNQRMAAQIDFNNETNHIHKLFFFLLQMMEPYSQRDQTSWILEWFVPLTAFQKFSEMLQCYVQQPQKSITSWRASR